MCDLSGLEGRDSVQMCVNSRTRGEVDHARYQNKKKSLILTGKMKTRVFVDDECVTASVFFIIHTPFILHR